MVLTKIIFRLIRCSSLPAVILQCPNRTYSVLQLKNCKKYVSIVNYKQFHETSNVRQKEEEKPPVEDDLGSKKKAQVITIWKNMTVRDLANALGKPINLTLGAMNPTIRKYYLKPSAVIDHVEIIEDIVKKFGKRYVFMSQNKKSTEKERIELKPGDKKSGKLVPRPPVVTIMGHVDHGKTTLLDYLRKSSIVESEFGGITQHIGAFSVTVSSGQKITFIDTPGHAAFTTMRARGAEVTDIVVLVVAADDGVMEQTVESIKIAEKAGVHVIVAINKIDKPNVDIDRVKGELFNYGIRIEDFGGDVQVVAISALKGLNVDKLVDAILLEGEMMDLKGDPKGRVEGVVIESRKDQRGKLASVLIKQGTLQKGKILVAESTYGRVRAMYDENLKIIDIATPSTPVQITGWKDLPLAGSFVAEVNNEKEAQKIIKQKEEEQMEQKLKQWEDPIKQRAEQLRREYLEKKAAKKAWWAIKIKKGWYEDRPKEFSDEKEIKVSLLIKGDVAGSVEAIEDALSTYDKDEECKLEVVECEVGNVTESDIEVAEAFNAIIYAFNVTPLPGIKDLAKSKNVEIRLFNIIYRLIDDLKEELSKALPLLPEEEILGEAEVLQNFFINERNKKVPVAGSKCISGILKKNESYRIIRDGNVIFDGKLKSMKHHKAEVDSINKNVDCGLMFDGFNEEFSSEDKIICYTINHVPQKTSWDPGF